jgi:hypothetical protein
VRRRVLLDYSADYPYRKRPPGKNYSFLLLQPKKYRAPFLKEAETGFFKNKANAITTTTNYTDLKTLRNHKPIASSTSFNEGKYEQTDSLWSFKRGCKITEKEKRNKQMINTLQTGIERLPPQGLRTDLKTRSNNKEIPELREDIGKQP